MINILLYFILFYHVCLSLHYVEAYYKYNRNYSCSIQVITNVLKSWLKMHVMELLTLRTGKCNVFFCENSLLNKTLLYIDASLHKSIISMILFICLKTCPYKCIHTYI